MMKHQRSCSEQEQTPCNLTGEIGFKENKIAITVQTVMKKKY